MASLNDWLDDQSDSDASLDDYRRPADANMVHYHVTAPGGGTDVSGAPTVSGLVDCRPYWGSGGCTGSNPNVGKPIPDNLNTADGANVARVVDWWVGPTSARVEFDLGDGNLTDAEVIWALEYVRNNRDSYLPLTDEYGVIAAGYSNLNHRYSACIENDHHDHRAVQEAVYQNDLIPTTGYHPQWGVSCGSQTTSTGIDPDVLPANGGRANEISNTHYRQNMSGLSGYFQNRFGWLADPGPWLSGSDPAGNVLFPNGTASGADSPDPQGSVHSHRALRVMRLGHVPAAMRCLQAVELTDHRGL